MGGLPRRSLLRSSAFAGAALITGCLGDGEEYGEAWRDVESIRLGATANRWMGLAPDPIVETQNPTLRLVHGRTYEIAWTNQDGEEHLLELRNTENERLARSPENGEVDDEERLEFDAVAGIDRYTCPHFEVTMTGDIEIFSPAD